MHRLLAPEVPEFPFSTDGAEMGKLMVAQGLGVTVLPDYSVVGDPLVKAGTLTYRPLSGDRTGVSLVMQTRPVRHVPGVMAALQAALQSRALEIQVRVE